MIYTLRGNIILSEVQSSAVVIECAGVGYRVSVSANTLANLPSPSFSPSGDTVPSEEVMIFTHMAVKEDGVELFGFKDKEELDTFKLLISVSGVGPKAAMSVLSLFTPKKLALVVASEDAKSISRAPGVGGKTSARIILELKDKLAKAFPEFDTASTVEAKPKNSTASDKAKIKDAQDALAVLGYSRSEIAAAMKAVDMSAPLEDIIKNSLAALMKQ